VNQNTENQTISICGCGWLGFPLGQRLVDFHFSVKGSTTRTREQAALKQAGITPYHLLCQPELQAPQGESFFHSDVLVLTIPFKRNLPDPWFYPRQIKSLIDSGIKHSIIKSIIFTSSTSAYSSCLGEVTEETLIDPQTERAKALIAAEELLLKESGVPVSVLRLGGLYGGTRKLGQRVMDAGSIKDSGVPVNLVHLDDVIAIITELIQSGIRNEILNVVSDGHPSRQELYAAVAERQGCEPPRFLSGDLNPRIVSNRRVKERLGFSFSHPDPMGDI